MKLGYADKGTAKVLIEVIDTAVHPTDLCQPASHSPGFQSLAPNQTPPITDSNPRCPLGNYLQVGAFSDMSLANELKGKIRGLTSKPMVGAQSGQSV